MPKLYSKEEAPKAIFDGKEIYIYTHGYVSEVCHGVKEHDKHSIEEMAYFLASLIKEDCFLVPAPQHTGKAEYTLEICKIIEKICPYEVTILDVLDCPPRETLWAIKKAIQAQNGVASFTKEDLAKVKAGISLKQAFDMIEGTIYFVDNVVSTGITLKEVEKLIPGVRPLVFAVSEKYL